MKVTPLDLPEVLLLEPEVFADDRGWFFESFNARSFAAATGLGIDFVQDNHARSRKGVLRGLHYQLPPSGQAKLVRVIAGEIFDVAVDMRRRSKSFGRWTASVLSAQNCRQMFIPEGFAHGYLVLTEGAEVLYKAGAFYDRSSERSVRWDDRQIGIAWPAGIVPILSEKDRVAPVLSDAETFV